LQETEFFNKLLELDLSDLACGHLNDVQLLEDEATVETTNQT